MVFLRSERGQATVELVALLPLLALVALGVWQAAVAGHAVWASGAASRAAARAAAVGGDPGRAASAAVPRAARPGLRVSVGEDGEARVSVAIPAVVGGGALGRVASTARFEEQR